MNYFLVVFFALLLVFLLIIRSLLKRDGRYEKVLVGNSQIIGTRKRQEDSFSTISNFNGVLSVVADGIGGFENGKLASSTAVHMFINQFSKPLKNMSINDFLINTIYLSNKEILEKSRGMKMGTTIVAVVVFNGFMYWASVGDSAIAVFKNGEFINLNKKHTFEVILKQKFNSGEITKSEVLRNTKKNLLTNYLGREEFSEVEVSKEPLKLEKGDRILLYSDGVYNSLSEMEMEKILMKNHKPQEQAEEMTNVIINKKPLRQDNATVIILEKK